MPQPLRIQVPTEDDMTALGQRVAQTVASGSVLLLNGPLGAGKTHLARAIIGSLLVQPEEVPSPTYTLVQVYQGNTCEIWHADLYRLGDSSEVIELGLDEAMSNAIVIIEWPDRLPPDLVPDGAWYFDIAIQGHERVVTVTTSDAAKTESWAVFADD